MDFYEKAYERVQAHFPYHKLDFKTVYRPEDFDIRLGVIINEKRYVNTTLERNKVSILDVPFKKEGHANHSSATLVKMQDLFVDEIIEAISDIISETRNAITT